MSAKPYRNSKGVNKPFRSPFNTPQNSSNKSSTNTQETPLHGSIAKRLSFEQSPSPKKLCLKEEDCDNKTDTKQKKELYQSDLEALKKRIQEKEQSVNSLKNSLLYKEKNKAKDLEDDIKKWTVCCQEALRDYQKFLQEANGQSVEMSKILSWFNAEPDVVHFSTDEDTFY